MTTTICGGTGIIVEQHHLDADGRFRCPICRTMQDTTMATFDGRPMAHIVEHAAPPLDDTVPEGIGWYISDTHARRAIGYLTAAVPELHGITVPWMATKWAEALKETMQTEERSPIGPESGFEDGWKAGHAAAGADQWHSREQDLWRARQTGQQEMLSFVAEGVDRTRIMTEQVAERNAVRQWVKEYRANILGYAWEMCHQDAPEQEAVDPEPTIDEANTISDRTRAILALQDAYHVQNALLDTAGTGSPEAALARAAMFLIRQARIALEEASDA